jgi:hypothetical protein
MNFSNIKREYPNFINIWHKKLIHYVMTHIHVWSCLAEFLEWKMFQQKMKRKSKHLFYIQKLFFPKIVSFFNNVKKYGRAGQATDGNILWCIRFACWVITTLWIYNTYYLPLQQWLCECTSMIMYTYSTFFVDNKIVFTAR